MRRSLAAEGDDCDIRPSLFRFRVGAEAEEWDARMRGGLQDGAQADEELVSRRRQGPKRFRSAGRGAAGGGGGVKGRRG
ncbi:hypothetical protein FGB62_552g00 [Gracilaria domingensis]|nr:hypothetical protein FGB62_552g00 [Gracilaria domingensis]